MSPAVDTTPQRRLGFAAARGERARHLNLPKPTFLAPAARMSSPPSSSGAADGSDAAADRGDDACPAECPLALRDALRGGSSAAALLARLDGPPGVAAFDADGTLWAGDLGEAVLQALLAAGALAAPPETWSEYQRRERRDPADGYAFAVAAMAGLEERRLRQIAGEVFADRFAAAVFPELRWLIGRLQDRAWDVWVVSGSNRWAVEMGAAAFGIPAPRVIGVDGEVAEGRLTGGVGRPVPTLEGKPALLAQRAGRQADLAFGNSVLDLPLLRAARLPVAVGQLRGSVPRRNQFLSQARRRGWARLEIPAAPGGR